MLLEVSGRGKEQSDRHRENAKSVDIITGECLEINYTQENSKPEVFLWCDL